MEKRAYTQIHGLSVEEFEQIEPILKDVFHHSTFSSGCLECTISLEFYSEGRSPRYKEKQDEKTNNLGRDSGDSAEPDDSDPLHETSWGSH